MHIQPLFAEQNRHALHRLIRAYPLATLITQTAQGADANLLPLDISDAGPNGRLSGHVARTHSLWCEQADGSDVLVMFQGPNAYISPRWYVNGQRSGRLAPSWNYVAVQARGRMRFIDDGHWVATHLASLTAQQESGRDRPWSLDDASPQFVEEASRHLIGFEIDIVELTGKRFLSQQRTPADRRSIVQQLGLETSGSARDLAALIAP